MANITQKQTTDFLNNLVSKRYNKEKLNKALEDFFKQIIILEESDSDCTDFNLMFNIENESEVCGYYDIYFLKMRNKGHDDSDMYITEIGIEFI